MMNISELYPIDKNTTNNDINEFSNHSSESTFTQTRIDLTTFPLKHTEYTTLHDQSNHPGQSKTLNCRKPVSLHK